MNHSPPGVIYNTTLSTMTQLNGSNCAVITYPQLPEAYNTTVVTLNGNYPEKGHLVNKDVDEYLYIIHGWGSVQIADTVFGAQEGTVLVIPKGMPFRYSIDSHQSMKILVHTYPKWTKEQHQNHQTQSGCDCKVKMPHHE